MVGLKIADQRYVATYKWIDGYGRKPWAVGAWIAAEDVTGELRRLLRAGVAGLVVALLAIAAAVVLGRLVARPIRRLAGGAARVGALDLAHVEALPPSRIKELNEQARAFNTMLAGLRSFETYVPRTLVNRLIGRGETREVASAEHDLTVMFTDVAGFTSMAEGRPASEIAGFLNEHFAMLGACVEAESGTVDKFIGDALMAFWGAPEPQEDSAPRAYRAALAMARAIEADNAKRRAAGRDPVHVRIGIHTGPVVVGNIGWPGRINYTIVGDTVNTCQRLEALGKSIDRGQAAERGQAATILLSGATAGHLDGGFELRRAGTFDVRGRAEALEVYELLA